MNRTLALLVLASVGGNAVLLVKRYAFPVAAEAPAPIVAAATRDDPAIAGAPDPEVHGRAVVAAQGGVDVWAMLGASDPRTLATNLRAAGMSEPDVLAAVRAVLAERYDQRRAALLAEAGPRPYWRDRRGDGLDATQRAELRDFERENDAMLRGLFGEVPMSVSESRTSLAMFGPLPDEKIRTISQIQTDYSDLRREIFASMSGSMLTWDREKIAYIAAEQWKDIEAALTPEERETYRLYGPGVVSSIRYELAGFEPTETEFHAILKIREEVASPADMGMIVDPTQARARAEAMEASKVKIKAELGEARYADYERVTDQGYKRAVDIVDRLGLPAANATAAYEVGRDIQARATVLNADRSLSAADRRSAVGALAREANERLGALLTPAGVAAYKTWGGYWLGNLESQGGVR